MKSDKSPWMFGFFACVLVAAALPISASRMILNEIVPCSFANLDQFSLAGKLTADGIPADLFQPLYAFGVTGAFVLLLSIATAIVSLGFASQALADAKAFGVVMGASLLALLALCFAKFAAISPHSCISSSLIDLTLGTLPDDSGQYSIGNLGSSLKDIFAFLYRAVLIAATIAIICFAAAMGATTAKIAFTIPVPADPDADTNKALNILTTLLLLISVSFAVEVVATQQYFAIGEQAVMASQAKIAEARKEELKAKPADKLTTGESAELMAAAEPDPVVLAYQSFTKAIVLHWGGVGSAVIGCVFVVGFGGIVAARAKVGLPRLPDQTSYLRPLVNLISVAVPLLTAAVQQWTSG